MFWRDTVSLRFPTPKRDTLKAFTKWTSIQWHFSDLMMWVWSNWMRHFITCLLDIYSVGFEIGIRKVIMPSLAHLDAREYLYMVWKISYILLYVGQSNFKKKPLIMENVQEEMWLATHLKNRFLKTFEKYISNKFIAANCVRASE